VGVVGKPYGEGRKKEHKERKENKKQNKRIKNKNDKTKLKTISLKETVVVVIEMNLRNY